MQQIKGICISDKSGPKSPVEKCKLIEDYGINNDIHAKQGSLKQISFLGQNFIDEMIRKGAHIKPGSFGENFIVDYVDIENINIGDIFRIGKEAVVEVTVIGKTCPAPCDIFKTIGMCIMPEYGIFAKVIKGGIVYNGDSISNNK